MAEEYMKIDVPGLNPDLEWAGKFDYWEQAAKNGNVLAKFHLAKCYENGTGVEQNYLKAAELYMVVSESVDERYSGDPYDPLWPQCDARFKLGFFYENCMLSDSTLQKAIEWYDSAAYCGSVDACFKLAELYMAGCVVEQNYDKVAKYLCLITPPYYTDERFFDIAKKLLNVAEEYVPWGILDALAECYENGFGTEQDRAKGKECREKAAFLRERQELEIKERLKRFLFPESNE